VGGGLGGGNAKFKNSKTNKGKSGIHNAKAKTRHMENNVSYRLDTKVQKEDSKGPHRRDTARSDRG